MKSSLVGTELSKQISSMSEVSESYFFVPQDVKNMLKLNVNFEIIAHEEQKFRSILELDGISPSDLMTSLDMDRNKH